MQEFDVAIIGSGPAGYVAAIRCAQLGLKTACIEKRKELGGTCLNVGCIPSKTLLASSHEYDKARRHFPSMGIETKEVRYNFSQMMQRKTEVITSLAEGIRGLFKKNKVTHLTGQASFLSPTTLSIAQGPTSEIITAKYFIIATGSEPQGLPFLPIDETRILSSTGALSLPRVPKRLIVIGAGVIGVELGSVYARLGSEVSFVEFLDTICPGMDGDISKGLQEALQKQGMTFHLSTKVVGADLSERSTTIKTSNSGKELEMSADAILVAIGRRPYSEGLALDKAGVAINDKRQVIVDSFFRTNVAHIFAIGDIIDGPMLAHKASEEGVAVAEIIAGKAPHVDYVSIPSVIYTHPEAASTGLTSAMAEKMGLSAVSASYPLRSNPRAKCMAEESGFMKVVAEKNSNRLLGVHILAPSASEMIPVACLAIQKRLSVSELGDLCFAHPTLSEAMKEAALSIQSRAIHK